MSCTLKESFERSCRLCAEEQEVTIMIFSKEAEALLLQNKLNQYLLIEVDENDSLPKNICIRCCTKLHTVCEFIDTARKSQEILLSRSVLLSQMTIEEPCEISYIKTEPINTHFQENQYFDKEESITQMEISIDPMLILQNCDGSELSPIGEEPPLNCGEEVAYLHGLESENVTIKLIRKCDTTELAKEEGVESKNGGDSFKPFPCVTCRRSFLTEFALKNHSWIHYNEDKHSKQFSCTFCKDSFDYKSDLLAHLKEHKSNVTCKVCGRVFRSTENLALHMESHATPSQAYICKVCGRAYNTSSNLKTHSITHSNERPYQCHLCKKSFKRNQDLKFHINQHTGARPYKCPYCEKCFASSGNCYSHRNRMHPGKKETLPSHRAPSAKRGWRRNQRFLEEREEVPSNHANGQSPAQTTHSTAKSTTKYKCQICGHGFMKKDNFTYHMYQHTGEKPFKCAFCLDKFVTRRGLTIHYDRAHPNVEKPLSLLTKNVLLS